MKEQPRSVYRSMQGKEIDMNKLINQNEMTVAVGNAKMNARGDELGPGGKIIRKRDEVIREHSIKVPVQQNVRPATQPVEAVDTKLESSLEKTTKTVPVNKRKV